MISFEDKLCLFLSSIEVSYKRANEILLLFNSAKDFFDKFESNDKIVEQALGSLYKKAADKYLNFCFNTLELYFNKNNVKYITALNANFPPSLLTIEQPPLVIYYKGDINLLNENCIAVVGTRTPSSYGKTITEHIVKTLSDNNFTIVSGLATGIDKIAHETALKNNGKTVAVLGNGFLHMYPAININLAKDIMEKGLIITEYFPSFKPSKYSFPARNRIISAISKGVFIPEAGFKSGAMHTKEYALEQGKDIFAVPGPINSIKSEGTNMLLKSGQAEFIVSADDILKHYNINKKNTIKSNLQLSLEENLIIKLLKVESLTFLELQEKTKLLTKTLNSSLTTMQIRGIIKKLPGNYYSVSEV